MKKTFGTAFGRKSEGNTILRLRDLLIILFISINAVSFSQSYTNSDFNQVNNIRYGLFNTCDSIWLAEPTRKSPVDAFEDLNVYKANHPTDDCMQIQAKGNARLDLSAKWRNEKTGNLTIEIDTIIATILSELDPTNKSAVHVDYSSAGTQPSAAHYYVSLKGIGLFIPIETDTIESWLRTVEFQRTKEFGKIAFKRIGTPFQSKSYELREITSTSFRIDTYFTSNHTIAFYQDDVLIKEFPSGTAEYIENMGWVSHYGYWNLTPDTEYDFEIIGYPHDEKEEPNTIKFKHRTPKQ